MSEEEAILWNLAFSLPLAGAAVLIARTWCGVDRAGLRDAACARLASQRRDELIGLALLGGGLLLGPALLRAWPEPPPSPNDNPAGRILRFMLVQTLAQGPALVWVLLRIRRTPRPAPTAPSGSTRAARTSEGASHARTLAASVAIGLLGWLLAMPIVFAAIGLAVAGGLIFDLPQPETGHELLEIVRTDAEPLTLLMLALSAVLVAPILEEAVFRGLVQTALVRWLASESRVPAILLTSLLFTFMHLQAVPWQPLVGLFVFSVALGVVYEKAGRLSAVMLMHAMFNAANLALQWLVVNRTPPPPG